MDRKAACEQIVLTKSEKQLLRRISRHPHTRCIRNEIWPLYEMDLVQPDADGVDAFGSPVFKDTYCVSEQYHIYQAYRSEQRGLLMLKSLWLPIAVSILTNLTVDGIQLLLPLTQRWFASFFG